MGTSGERAGIGAALARTTLAFAVTGRPAPSTLGGQLWAALTRSTPAFSGTAQLSQTPVTSVREGRSGSSVPIVVAHEGGLAYGVIGGNVHVQTASEETHPSPPKVNEGGTSQLEESARLLTESIRQLSRQLAEFMAGNAYLANEAQAMVAALNSATREMADVAQRAPRAQEDTAQGITALVQALGRLTKSSEDLAENVRWLVDRQKKEDRVREEIRTRDDSGRRQVTDLAAEEEPSSRAELRIESAPVARPVEARATEDS